MADLEHSVTAPADEPASTRGLRGWLMRRMLGDWLELQARQQRELLALQAAQARARAEAREAERSIRTLFEVLRDEQAGLVEQLDRRHEQRSAELVRELADLRIQTAEKTAALQTQLAEQARRAAEALAAADARETAASAALDVRLETLGRQIETEAAQGAQRAEQLRASLQSQLDEYGTIIEERSAQSLRNTEQVRESMQTQLNQYGQILQDIAQQALDRDERLRSSVQEQLGKQVQALNAAGESWREVQLRLAEGQQAQLAAQLRQRQEFEKARHQVAEAQQQLDAAVGKLSLVGAEIEAARKLREEMHAESMRRAELALSQMAEELGELRDPVGPEFEYTAFEDRFRGSEELIRERQAIYVQQLKKRGPVLDLGCGRGELLRLLHEAGIAGKGVEINAEQAARCRARGLEVVVDDFMNWLPRQPAATYGTVVALQVVEHLPLRKLRALIGQARRVLKPGGLVLFETVNPHCAEAMEWFYIDPTHQRPIYPEMLDFMLEQAGFAQREIRYQIPCSTAPKNEPPTSATGGDYAIWGVKK